MNTILKYMYMHNHEFTNIMREVGGRERGEREREREREREKGGRKGGRERERNSYLQ